MKCFICDSEDLPRNTDGEHTTGKAFPVYKSPQGNVYLTVEIKTNKDEVMPKDFYLCRACWIKKLFTIVALSNQRLPVPLDLASAAQNLPFEWRAPAMMPDEECI